MYGNCTAKVLHILTGALLMTLSRFFCGGLIAAAGESAVYLHRPAAVICIFNRFLGWSYENRSECCLVSTGVQ